MPKSTFFLDGQKNLFGLSTYVWGVFFLLLAAIFDAIDSVMITVAADEGFSSNALTFWISIGSLAGAILVDLLFYLFIGYESQTGKLDRIHWFCLTDIFRREQWELVVSMPSFLFWFFVFGSSNYWGDLFELTSFVFADNVADSITIYDMYPLIIPIFGLCLKHKHDGFEWRHRYWLCFLIAIIGLILLSQPGFIFGYSSDVNSSNQVLACILALISSVWAALYVVSNTIMQVLSDEAKRNYRNGNINNINSNSNMGDIRSNEDTPLMPVSSSNTNTNDTGGKENDNNGVASSNTNNMIDRNEIEYIMFDQIALVTVCVEYASVITLIWCVVFTPFSLINGSWFWDEFVLFYDSDAVTSKGIWYTVGGSILWWFDYYFYTFGIFMLRDATMSGLLDVSDVMWTFILSYFWLNEGATIYDGTGSVLVVIAIIIVIYPWRIHKKIPKWW